jgi:chromosome segregation ATPase
MVIRPDPRVGALTHVRRRQWGPWWLWTIVAVLAGGATYAGYRVRDAQLELARVQAAQMILIANRENLQASRQELREKLQRAGDAEAKLRGDGDRLAALVGKLEKRVTGLEAELKEARAALEESKSAAEALAAAAAESRKTADKLAAEAAGAKTAYAQVARLQERLAALKSEHDAAKAEASQATQEKSALEREIAQLKDELGKMQPKAAPEMTGSTPAATP